MLRLNKYAAMWLTGSHKITEETENTSPGQTVHLILVHRNAAIEYLVGFRDVYSFDMTTSHNFLSTPNCGQKLVNCCTISVLILPSRKHVDSNFCAMRVARFLEKMCGKKKEKFYEFMSWFPLKRSFLPSKVMNDKKEKIQAQWKKDNE